MIDGVSRGILYPARLPTFRRITPPDALAHLVRWFWIPRWDVAPGRVSRQAILPYPASNLYVDPAGVAYVGPTTRASHRDLTGTGWTVGALLRPAAVPSLGVEPRRWRDAETPYDAPDLHTAISEAMRGPDAAAADAAAAEAYAGWLARRCVDVDVDDQGVLANDMEDLIATDRTIVRVDQLAHELGLSVRAVQRVAVRHFGLPPLHVIRRYRLQEAVERLREEPDVTVADVAADLGYADHAHLTGDFRKVLGLTPTTYRRDAT